MPIHDGHHDGGGLTGARKTAILLLSLDDARAAAVMNRLPAEAAARVAREIELLRDVPAETRARVLDEFCQITTARAAHEPPGRPAPRTSLDEAAARLSIERAIEQVGRRPAPPPVPVPAAPFAFLRTMSSAEILLFIRDEHPQTIALILAHLPSGKAADVMTGLPGPKQIEVVKRVARMEEEAGTDVIEEIERGLRQRLGGDSVALHGDADEQVVQEVEVLGPEEPHAAVAAARTPLAFEDIELADDEDLRAALAEVDDEEVGLALSTAGEHLRRKILKNLPDETAREVRHGLKHMAPVRVDDVEAARQKIVDGVRRRDDSADDDGDAEAYG